MKDIDLLRRNHARGACSRDEATCLYCRREENLLRQIAAEGKRGKYTRTEAWKAAQSARMRAFWAKIKAGQWPCPDSTGTSAEGQEEGAKE